MKIHKIKEPKISVLIANYNNSLFLKRCINSVLRQNYKKKEIIVVDDKSSDDSLNILKKYKNQITILKKKKKFNVGSYDQMSAYKIAIKKSSGQIIFFLDSDDFFFYKKLKIMVNYFKKNINNNIFMDRAIFFYQNKKKFKLAKRSKSNFLFSWPKFSQQSCICIRRNYLLKIYDIISIKKFPSVWLDFRISVYNYVENKDASIVNEFLTFYQQSDNSASSNYKFFSINWWIRRKEAYDYFNYINKKLNNKKYFSLDFFITRLFNFIFIKRKLTISK